MIIALGFFVNGRLKLTDYSAFVRANSLSQEQLLSAKHFLQRDQLFADGTESELLKWYSDFTTRVTNSYEDGKYFDTRHKFVSNVVNDHGVESGANYLLFMTETVLPRIVETQQMIKNDIRFIEFIASALYRIVSKISFFIQQSNARTRHERRKAYGIDVVGAFAACGIAVASYNSVGEERN